MVDPSVISLPLSFEPRDTDSQLCRSILDTYRLTRHMRRTNAATYLQKRWRGYSQRQKYLHVRCAIVTIQAFTRGTFGRRYYTSVLREARACRARAGNVSVAVE